MNPEVWGSTSWDVLLTLAQLAAPEALVAVTRVYAAALPCHSCRTAFARILQLLPFYADDGHTPVGYTPLEWVYMLRDTVNQKLGKQSVAFEAVVAKCALFAPLVCVHGVLHFWMAMAVSAYEAANEEAAVALVEAWPDLRRLCVDEAVFGAMSEAVRDALLMPVGATDGDVPLHRLAYEQLKQLYSVAQGEARTSTALARMHQLCAAEPPRREVPRATDREARRSSTTPSSTLIVSRRIHPRRRTLLDTFP